MVRPDEVKIGRVIKAVIMTTFWMGLFSRQLHAMLGVIKLLVIKLLI